MKAVRNGHQVDIRGGTEMIGALEGAIGLSFQMERAMKKLRSRENKAVLSAAIEKMDTVIYSLTGHEVTNHNDVVTMSTRWAGRRMVLELKLVD